MDDIPSNLKNDPKFKKYQQAIEKSLQSFESVGEWADIISFLNRLSKSINSYPNCSYIPEKLLVNKRLAQCLNPNLPTGVHQKALEVYDIVFIKIKAERLLEDLSLYTLGLFPLFEHASTAVRSSLLNIFERHLLPLSTLPCLTGLIFSLLPGLEEETGEQFGRVYNLFNKLSEKFPSLFYGALWFLLRSTTKHRVGIFHFLMRDLPLKLSNQKNSLVIFSDTKEVAAGLTSALQDKNSLLARGVLDLLIQFFPVSTTLFMEKEQIQIVKEAMLILCRRDMSLTRRFNMWVSPEDVTSDKSIHLQTEAFRDLLREIDGQNLERDSRAFKLIVFVMDRSNISTPILKATLTEIISSLWKTFLISNQDYKEKILASANLFFDILDLDLAWSRIFNFVKLSIINPDPAVPKMLLFALQNLSICDDEALEFHIPLLLLIIASSLQNGIENESSMLLNSDYFSNLLELAQKAMDMVQNKLFVQAPKANSESNNQDYESFHQFLEKYTAGNAGKSDLSLNINGSDFLIMSLLSFQQFLRTNLTSYLINENSKISFAKQLIDLNVSFFRCLGQAHTSQLTDEILPSNWCSFLFELCMQTTCVDLWKYIIDAIYDIQAEFDELNIMFDQNLLSNIWMAAFSSSSSLIDIAHIIKQLYKLQPHFVDSFLIAILSLDNAEERIKSIGMFFQLWSIWVADEEYEHGNFFKPLLIVVDLMKDSNTDIARHCRSWLQCMDQKSTKILEGYIEILIEALPAVDDDGSLTPLYTKSFNISQVIYAINSISTIYKYGADGLTLHFSSKTLPGYIESLLVATLPLKYRFDYPFDYTFTAGLLQLIIAYGSCGAPKEFSKIECAQIEDLQVYSLSLISLILEISSNLTQRELLPIYTVILQILQNKECKQKPERTPLLLGLLLLVIEKISESAPAQNLPINLKDLSLISSYYLGSVEDPGIINDWIGFSISIAEFLSSPWEDYFSLQIGTLTKRVKEFNSNLNSAPIMLFESILKGIDQIGAFGLSLILNEKIQQPYQNSQTSRLKSRRLEIWKNALTRNSSSSLMSNLNDIRSPISRDLQIVIFEFSVSYHLLSTSLINFSLTTKSILYDILKHLYSLNPHILTASILTLFNNHVNEYCENSADFKHFSLFLDCCNGPFGTDFLKNLVTVYRNLKETNRQEFYVEILNLDTFFLFMSQISVPLDSISFATDMWAFLILVVKDLLSNSTKYRTCFHFILAWSTYMLRIIYGSTSEDHKKPSKDQQELFSKFLESSISHVSKIIDPSFWKDWPEQDKFATQATIDWPVFFQNAKNSVKDRSILELFIVKCDDLISLLPVVFFDDNERLLNLIGLLFSTIIIPVSKGSIRKHYPGILGIYLVNSIATHIPQSNKIWKKDLIEMIIDPQYFNLTGSLLSLYFVVSSLSFDYDPDRLVEFLARISTPSTTIFLSREMENTNKTMAAKRLAYAILCSSKKNLTLHLSGIQEKVVELLRTSSPATLPVIFLLLRVLFFKLGPESMASLWPAIMIELVSVFDSVLSTNRDRPSKDICNSFFQSCKFLDMVLLLSPSTILTYAWNFISSVQDSRIVESYFLKVANKFPNNEIVTSDLSLVKKMHLRGKFVSIPEMNHFLSQAHHYLHQSGADQFIDLEVIKEDLISDFIEDDY